MYKIVIQNTASETIIQNIHPEELDFWQTLLQETTLQGDIKVIDVISGQEHQAA